MPHERIAEMEAELNAVRRKQLAAEGAAVQQALGARKVGCRGVGFLKLKARLNMSFMAQGTTKPESTNDVNFLEALRHPNFFPKHSPTVFW